MVSIQNRGRGRAIGSFGGGGRGSCTDVTGLMRAGTQYVSEWGKPPLHAAATATVRSPSSLVSAYLVSILYLNQKCTYVQRISVHVRRTVTILVGILLMKLSIPVVMNLLSPQQAMNTSFDAFRIVNTYGAFGSITKIRTEVVFQGTLDHEVNESTVWNEYQFICKPGKRLFHL